MRARFSDAQCGFKAMRTDIARELLPYVEDTGWFFDTELLVVAERIGLRIAEVPVDWIDDPNSSVDIVATAVADLRGCARVGRALSTARCPSPNCVPAWAGRAIPARASRASRSDCPVSWRGSVWWVWRRRSCTRCCT